MNLCPLSPNSKQVIFRAVEDVIDGQASNALLDFDLDLKEKSPFCQIKSVKRQLSEDSSESQFFIKITPLIHSNENLKGCSLAFCDRNCSYLKPHDYQFADQDIYKIQGKAFSILQRLVAPSFGGPKALDWIKNVSGCTDIEKLYISDGSVTSTYKCCKDSSLISLKLLQIFKSGETWYEQHGANPSLDEHLDFETFKFLNDYLEKVFETNLFEEKYLKENYLYLLRLAQTEFHNAFAKAKSYLHQLKASDLLSSFEPYKNHPILGEIYQNTLMAVEKLNISEEMTIGQITKQLISHEALNQDESLHRLSHSFLESVISFNNKFLLAYYLEKLQSPQSIKELLLAIVLSMHFIECFLGYFFDLTIPYHNTVDDSQEPIIDFISFCLTSERADLKLYLQEIFSKRAEELPERAVEKWKVQNQDFMDTHYFEHNHPENLKNMLSHIFLGPESFDYPYFVSLFFTQLKLMRVSHIEKWMPSFSHRVNYLIGHKVFTPGSCLKIEEIIANVEKDPKLLKRTVCGLTNYFLQAAKFFPSHCLSDMDENDHSMDHFFLAKTCAFNLGPFEFKLQSDAYSDAPLENPACDEPEPAVH